ncbi:precorrin-6y C5,15-methyltransferase (decarboxylating) subunit CbiE [Xanthobacter sp. TB0139]
MSSASCEALPMPWLTLVGIGENGRDGLCPAALQALEEASLVVGGSRHLALAAPFSGKALAWPSPMHEAFPDILARRRQKVCVLASGDPFHHGVGSLLARLVPADEMRTLPAPSAFSLAAARMGWAVQDCTTISLHGRMLERIIPQLAPRRRLLVLTWDETTPAKLADLLCARGFGPSTLTVLEALGGPREQIRAAQAEGFALSGIDPLNIIALEVVAGPNARPLPLTPGMVDDSFVHDGQITKAEIRALTLAALAPLPGETLWDIGAGSGSISIEWCLRHPSNRALAVEAHPERAGGIARNRLNFGAEGLKLVVGKAPAALEGLPAPDAIFIGGGLTVPGLFEAAWSALPEGGRLVANAVTLESEARLAALHGQHGGQMRRISIDRLSPVGRLHGWRPAMPVTQWRVVKPARSIGISRKYSLANTAPIMAGFGMTEHVSAEILLDVFAATVKLAGIEPSAVTGLATLARHAELPACKQAAACLGLPIHPVDLEDLPVVDARVITRSERIIRRFGTGSVAEAAALLVAGEQARIIVPRQRAKTERCSATCALAAVPTQEEPLP